MRLRHCRAVHSPHLDRNRFNCAVQSDRRADIPHVEIVICDAAISIKASESSDVESTQCLYIWRPLGKMSFAVGCPSAACSDVRTDLSVRQAHRLNRI